MSHIDKFFFWPHANVDKPQAAILQVVTHDKRWQERDADPSEGCVSHHVPVVNDERCPAAHDRCTIRIWEAPVAGAAIGVEDSDVMIEISH
jgi:hypothetical protein